MESQVIFTRITLEGKESLLHRSMELALSSLFWLKFVGLLEMSLMEALLIWTSALKVATS